jgi:uncharacterized HAD superfamily protein
MNIFFIVDIDGTVCDSMGRVVEMCNKVNLPFSSENVEKIFSSDDCKHFFSEEIIMSDGIIPGAEKLLSMRNRFNANLVFLTGRDEKFRKETMRWLNEKFGATNYSLYMRPSVHDGKTVPEYKENIFIEEIYKHNKNKYFVFFDDDSRVLELYGRFGVIFQAPGCWDELEVASENL